MSRAAAKPDALTYADYLSWDDDTRWQIIEGEAHAMSPAPSRVHQSLLLALASAVHRYLRGRPCEAYIAPFDVRLAEPGESDDEASTVVQPDLLVVCDSHKLDRRGCRGAPDWIVEILSPATAGIDQVKKRRLYERHGVREYWLVHPIDHVVTVYLHDGDSFGPASISEMADTQAVSIFPELILDWDDLLLGIPQDEDEA